MRSQNNGRFIDHNESEGIEPRKVVIAPGEELSNSQASTAICVKGEHTHSVPGSESMVGNRIVCAGTWENHIAPATEASNEPKRQRRKYGDMVVGLTHIRGVNGVIPIESQEPGTLEGVSSKTQRAAEASAIHRDGYNTTLTKLALISEQARKEPKFQFTSLAHLLNEGFLKECYFGLCRDRASGIDGVSWKVYGERLDENICSLVVRLKSKQYKPKPSRRVYIPKDDNSKRPLGLPALEDKIVQRGIALILEAIYEQDFLDFSYGFRPRRSCHQALSTIGKTIQFGNISYVIEADIKRFFDNVSHEWLIKCLEVRIKDSSMLLLIRRFLKAGYIESGTIVSTNEGTPQGGNLSPILSNIFLHYVLDLWFEKKIKTQFRGTCHLVRYADDFICMTENYGDARYIERAIRERFDKFALEMHPEKTRIISFNRWKNIKSKGKLQEPRVFDFLGFTHYWGKSRKGSPMLYCKTSAKRFRRACNELSAWLQRIRSTEKPKEWWPVLQAKLRGHYQYYGISSNCRAIGRYYHVTKRLVFKWLNRRSQKRSFSWERYNAYLRHYPLPKACIVHKMFTTPQVL